MFLPLSTLRKTDKDIMPVRSPKELTQALKHRKLEPVYLLFGSETYLRDEAARAIANEALRDTLLREFNESSFSLTTDDVRDAVAVAERVLWRSAAAAADGDLSGGEAGD